MNAPGSLATNNSYFEYRYSATPRDAGKKTLIVSFPGRKGNRLATSSPDDNSAFLWDVLNNSDADLLFIRSVYDGDSTKANITDDYDLLPGFLRDLREQNNIDRVVLFGFSLGCGPCLWLARKHVADDVVLVAPGAPALATLMAIDDLRWEYDFERFQSAGYPPQIEQYPDDIRVKIIHGLNLEADRLRENDIVRFLKTLVPQATVEGVQGVGHYIPYYWRDQGVLQSKVMDILEIKPKPQIQSKRKIGNWLRLDNALDYHPMRVGITQTHCAIA